MGLLTVSYERLQERMDEKLADRKDVSILDLFEAYVDAASVEIDMVKEEDLRAMMFRQFKHYGDFDASVMENARTLSGVQQTTQNVITAIDRQDTVSLKHAYGELKKYRQRIAELEDEMYKDELTGVYNRKYLFANKLETNYLFKSDGAMFLLRLDDFETFNAHYGHKAGDAVLRLFATRAASHMEDDRIEFIRYTGNNFIILTPQLHATEAAARLKSLDAYFRAKKFKVLQHDVVRIGFSFAQYHYARGEYFDAVFNTLKQQVNP